MRNLKRRIRLWLIGDLDATHEAAQAAAAQAVEAAQVAQHARDKAQAAAAQAVTAALLAPAALSARARDGGVEGRRGGGFDTDLDTLDAPTPRTYITG